MTEDIRGWKSICEFVGVGYKRTAKKNIRALERATGMRLLLYENNRPFLNRTTYRSARMTVAMGGK